MLSNNHPFISLLCMYVDYQSYVMFIVCKTTTLWIAEICKGIYGRPFTLVAVVVASLMYSQRHLFDYKKVPGLQSDVGRRHQCSCKYVLGLKLIDFARTTKSGFLKKLISSMLNSKLKVAKLYLGNNYYASTTDKYSTTIPIYYLMCTDFSFPRCLY